MSQSLVLDLISRRRARLRIAKAATIAARPWAMASVATMANGRPQTDAGDGEARRHGNRAAQTQNDGRTEREARSRRGAEENALPETQGAAGRHQSDHRQCNHQQRQEADRSERSWGHLIPTEYSRRLCPFSTLCQVRIFLSATGELGARYTSAMTGATQGHREARPAVAEPGQHWGVRNTSFEPLSAPARG